MNRRLSEGWNRVTAAKGAEWPAPDKLERIQRLRALAGRIDNPVDRALIRAVAAELDDLRRTVDSQSAVIRDLSTSDSRRLGAAPLAKSPDA